MKLKTLLCSAAALVGLTVPLAASADGEQTPEPITATNPVTGETETYENVFTNADTDSPGEWNATGNWTLKEAEKVPFVSGGNYDPALVDGETVSTSTAIDGWTLRVGAYNGAAVTWNGGITKIQAGSVGCWLTADETSSITIASFGGAQLEGNAAAPFKLSSAKAGGITWSAGLTSSSNNSLPFWYYLKGEGTVVYGGDITVANAQVIKMADVTLSGNEKSVQSKTLVTFDSGTTKTFTADAAVKIKDGDNVLRTVYLTSVTAGATTLTTAADVGTCELVQTATGIVLYWVDGDPAALPAPTVYKPSININFTNGAANGLTTGADVGLAGYEVPGTSWNNYVVGNSTFSTVNAVDSTGAASAMSGVSVTISGTRGSYSCSSLTPSSNPLHGYIDENDGNPTPTVTVTGIPYYKYRVLVYHSTDTGDAQFNYDTINGTDYTYVNDALAEGTTAWGAAGAQDSANEIAEGSAEAGNVLVTGELSGSTLTVVGHRGSGSVRGCIAAIQIVEVKVEVGENDLEIPVSDDTTYTVDETKELSGTVYLTGSGTLTLAGENKISAATIEVGDLVTLVVNADRLDATTFTGAGTVVYDGTKPASGKGWTDSTWTGTVWVKNIPTSSNERKDWDLALYGNADSTLRFTGVNLFFPNNTTTTFPGTVDIDGEGMNVCDGYGGSIATFARLTGSGTLSTTGGSSNGNGLTINDASGFTGTITLTKYKVIVGTSTGTSASGVLQVESGKSITVAGATAPGGFVVNGTLNVDGTLASSHATKAVSGTGTVVFTGRAPTVSGDAWWKNADWTGTVQIDSITDLVGTSDWGSGTYLDFNSYGNANSVIKLGNITGWLAGDTCNVPVNLAGTLTINNGFSGSAFTFKKLISNGGYITATDQSATARIVIEDGSEFAGYIGLNAKMVVFGTDNPSFVKGQVYVSSDAAITVPAVNTAYWAVGNIVVAGELKADSLARFGGGTHINTTGDGVFTLTSTGNGQETETDTDYARISGTDGSLKYEGTGWRALSTNNFPTAVTLVNEQAGDILLSRALTYTVGSLAGSKNFQGNYDSGSRYLNVIQSKDTEWSGKVTNDGSSRFAGLKLDASSTGTLTLSGTATQSVALEVNGGAVNLTGTWKGATTVAGTFGGTGTLTGDLTFAEGSTFKAFAADEDGLAVSGTITYPAEGTVTVDVSAIEADTDVALLAASGLDKDKFTLTGAPEGASLDVVEGVLTLLVPHVTITVPEVANATVTVAIGDETIGTAAGVYNVAPGSVVTVTYAAPEGYELSGTASYTIDTANNETTFDPTGTTVAQYVASITSGELVVKYTSLQAAFDAVANNNKIVLLASTEDGAVVPSTAMTFYFYAGSFECGTIADAVGDFVTTVTDAEITIDEVEVSAKKYRVAAAVAVVTIPNEGATNYGDHMQAYNAFLAGPAGTTMRVIGSNPFATDIPCTTYDSETQTYTKLAAVASITVGQVTTNYPSLAEACTAAEENDPVPTVVLLVALGEQTVPTGWDYNDPETSQTDYGTLTKSEAPAGTTYIVTGTETLDSTGSFSVSEGTTTIKIGDYNVTDGFSIDGTTATLLAPEVVEEANKKAVDIGTENVTLNVELVPGLYYGVDSGTGLTFTRPATLTQFDGTNGDAILTVAKPSAAKGFFRVFVDIKQ